MSGHSHLRRVAFSTSLALLFLLLGFGPPAAHADIAVTISGKCNVFGAGHATAPGPGGSVGGGDGGGLLPIEVTLPAGTGRSCTIDLTGTIDYGGCRPTYGPDGKDFVGLVPQAIYDGNSGTDLPVRAYFVAGVFLDDTESSDPAPDRLITADITFAQLSPALRQVFFIGDGWTGTATGSAQAFHIPDGATRLFLGYQDRCSTSPNIPGCYDDNSGVVTGAVAFTVPTATLPIATTRMRLDQNVPNPFNPRTTISFSITGAGHCELDIYNSSGQLV